MTPNDADQATWPAMAAILVIMLAVVLIAATFRHPNPDTCQLDPRASGDIVCIELAP